MADNFGLKIGLEGEKEFKNSLAEINQAFKVLGSEMKLVESEFDKNDKSVEALTARNEVLGKQITAQKEKIEVLRAALKNASDSFGENDKRTQAWQIQLNNKKIFQERVTLFRRKRIEHIAGGIRHGNTESEDLVGFHSLIQIQTIPAVIIIFCKRLIFAFIGNAGAVGHKCFDPLHFQFLSLYRKKKHSPD